MFDSKENCKFDLGVIIIIIIIITINIHLFSKQGNGLKPMHWT